MGECRDVFRDDVRFAPLEDVFAGVPVLEVEDADFLGVPVPPPPPPALPAPFSPSV